MAGQAQRAAEARTRYGQECDHCGATATTATIFAFAGGTECREHLGRGDELEYKATIAAQLAAARAAETTDERETRAAYERLMFA